MHRHISHSTQSKDPPLTLKSREQPDLKHKQTNFKQQTYKNNEQNTTTTKKSKTPHRKASYRNTLPKLTIAIAWS